MRKILVLLAFTLAGCASESYKLGPEWRPLEEIRVRPRIANGLMSDTAITTVGRYCYVKDLDEWLGRVPPGSIKFNAIMRHEQEHAHRQKKQGEWLWISRYSVDREFALEEEKIGYYYEITERRRLGDRVIPEAYALVLSKYKILSGKLISYEDALVWVRSVLDGTWTP